MSKMAPVLLVGAFAETVELCSACGVEVFGILDNEKKGEFAGCRILGSDADAGNVFRRHPEITVVIAPDQPVLRMKLAECYRAIGFGFANLIHPDAALSPSSHIGAGVVIQRAVNISANVKIDDFVKINTGGNIMHDSRIGTGTTVAPNAVVLGRVSVAPCCYIGANATVLPGLSIGTNAVVGAGTLVSKPVLPDITVVGNPARPMAARPGNGERNR